MPVEYSSDVKAIVTIGGFQISAHLSHLHRDEQNALRALFEVLDKAGQDFLNSHPLGPVVKNIGSNI